METRKKSPKEKTAILIVENARKVINKRWKRFPVNLWQNKEAWEWVIEGSLGVAKRYLRFKKKMRYNWDVLFEVEISIIEKGKHPLAPLTSVKVDFKLDTSTSLRRLKEKEDRKLNYISGLVHNFRTPDQELEYTSIKNERNKARPKLIPKIEE